MEPDTVSTPSSENSVPADTHPRLSLHEVLNAPPAEDPGETKLLRSLEEGNSGRRSFNFRDGPTTTTATDEDSAPSPRVYDAPPYSPGPLDPPHEDGVDNSNDNGKPVGPVLAVEDELAHLASSLSSVSHKSGHHHHHHRKRTSRGVSLLAKDPSVATFERDAATLMNRAAKGRRLERSKHSRSRLSSSGSSPPPAAENEGSNASSHGGVDPEDNTNDVLILQEFKTFMGFRKKTFLGAIKAFVIYSLIPFGGISAFLFRFFPQAAGVEDEEPEVENPTQAAVSWWILFVGVRQVLTLMLAKFSEDIIINFLAVQTKVALNIIGPFFTLMLVQSKGWPFQLFAWASIDFAILYGDSEFVRHWLFFLEEWIPMFSEENTAGKVLQSANYRNLLVTSLFVAASIALKRFFLGLWYGQSVFWRYGQELTNVIKRVLLIQKVAALAYDRQALTQGRGLRVGTSQFGLAGGGASPATMSLRARKQSVAHNAPPKMDVTASKLVIDTTARDAFSGGELSISQKLKVADLLGAWEEPTVVQQKMEETASISAVVNFRAALTLLDQDYPFSSQFGKASSREDCIDSSQRLFLQLQAQDGEDGTSLLRFDLLAALALKKTGELDEEKLKSIIEVFRPTRDGRLTMLEFVKSIDTVYKDLRILQASVENARKMNAASQEIFDSGYYFLVAITAMGLMGINALALIGSVTAFVVSLAFMIGGATSNWFEGMLFMLVRKPYDIGDRIAVSSPDNEVSQAGSTGWIVKDVNLYYTTVIFSITMEEATYSNFSLSDLRIINHNRSPKAGLNFIVRMGIATPKQKIESFAAAVTDYVNKNLVSGLPLLRSG